MSSNLTRVFFSGRNWSQERLTCLVSHRVYTRTQVSWIWMNPVCFIPHRTATPWHCPASNQRRQQSPGVPVCISRICSPAPGNSYMLPAPLPSPPVNHSYSACRVQFRCPLLPWEAWLSQPCLPTLKLYPRSRTSTLSLCCHSTLGIPGRPY